ncbi:ATP-binding protein [Actinoallomurus liliacearum]|uniref:sensor histidine kinase n=1 Tax=Actinoallomurus liliacearum TaxID=1080073 RepID=UPI0031E70072
MGLVAVMGLMVAGSSSPKARLILIFTAAGAVTIVCGATFAADMATHRERRVPAPPSPGLEDVQRRLGELAFLISRGREDLRGLTERIVAGEALSPRGVDPRPAAISDPVMHLAHELRKAQNEAWNALIDVANRKPHGGPAQRVEVFVNLSRRMQTLSHRAIQGLDELENRVEDPELLKGLFRVDHLATRIRRQAESLAVIGGGAPRRQWSRSVTVYEVLRSAIAEVEHYRRVKVVPPVEGTLDGGAVADVIHLLAELVENATRFAPPETQVYLRTEAVAAGLAIEVEDRGLGIPRQTQRRLNELLAGMEDVDTDEFVAEGRIGLLVVSALSRRHKVAVRLQTNIYGGTQAVVVIPNELIGSEVPGIGAHPAAPPESAGSVSAPSPDGRRGLSASSSSSTFGPGAVQTSAPSAHDDAAGARQGGPSEPWRDQTVSRSARQTERRTERQLGQASPASGDRRPELPRRRAQTNLVPELLNAPPPRDDDAETSHNHGLMAAFRKGMLSGQEEDLIDGAGETGS